MNSYDFVATAQPGPESGQTTLRFELPAQGNTLREARFENMLKAIGADLDEGTLKGSPAQIIDALDNAIHLAPKTNPRF